MRPFILLSFVLPLTFLVFGYTITDTPNIMEPPNIINPVPPGQHTNLPIIVQVEHQDFPFDVDGNFPYIVMVDNVVWQFNKDDVKEFVSKGRGMGKGEGHPRTRLLVE